LLYRVEQKRVDISNRLGLVPECAGQTDRRTDRTALAIARSNDSR